MRPGRDGQTAATLRDKKDSVDALLAEWRRERPDLDPSPVAILGRLHRISARLQRRVEAWLDPLDLTWESFSKRAEMNCHRLVGQASARRGQLHDHHPSVVGILPPPH